MKLIAQEMQIVSGFLPADLGTARTGEWVSLRNHRHCAILVHKNTGAEGEPPMITLEQARDISGEGAKALTFTTIYVKNGADLGAIAQFTKVTQAAAATYALAAGNTEVMMLIEINSEDLDADNNFDCLRAKFADVGSTAQIGDMLYLLTDPRYSGLGAVAELPVNS